MSESAASAHDLGLRAQLRVAWRCLPFLRACADTLRCSSL
jgi:hypothetical protein